ncbi:MAG: hypothetical protein WD276_07610 [Actinomycetota bacterium]
MRAIATFDLPLFSKGAATIAMAFVLFVGSVYVILAAVFGRRMGYLVLATCFFSWMLLLSALWAFGFWSQGPETPTNLGPRGTEPHWQPIAGGFEVASDRFPVTEKYPGDPWRDPTGGALASVDPVKTTIAEFMAETANEQAGIETLDGVVPAHAGGTITQEDLAEAVRFIPEDFSVEDVRFTAVDGTSLAAGRAFYNNGGPEVTVVAYHDSGNVPVYSYIFLAASVLGLAVHLPFLDRAERKRKEILTGGTAPPWRGPA